jgi:histidine ammonia-lyase
MVKIDGQHLNLEDIIAVARDFEEVMVSNEGIEQINRGHQWLETIQKSGKAVYGINTGFGIFSEQRIPEKDSSRLSRNLILSHSVGCGEPFPQEIVRAAILVRANTLTKGHSGVRLELVQTLLDMLNKKVAPVIPCQGSLGSSGDLIPLSHLGLVLSTDDDDLEEESGWVFFEGRIISGKAAMQAAGIPRIILGPKEGLALNNGATFSAATAALAIYDARKIYHTANAALSLSLEALLGCSAAFDPRLHEIRGQVGQIQAAGEIRSLFAGSTLLDSNGKVQDAYSLRCAAQIHGATLDTLNFVEAIILREINAATDNPLLFSETEVLSGGNFHGEPIAMAMDYLKIAIAEIGAVSERRVARMIDQHLNHGLPAMLVDSPEDAGLNSGLMMPQYTAAALVLENQSLAHPDSVHSLPTSANQEDHNANAMTAARHARMVVTNTIQILAIELYSAARAMDLRLRENTGKRPGTETALIYQKIRAAVPYRAGDIWWGPEIEKVKQLIEKEARIFLRYQE